MTFEQTNHFDGMKLVVRLHYLKRSESLHRRLSTVTLVDSQECHSKNALGMPVEEFERVLQEGGFEKYRAMQAYQFVHLTSNVSRPQHRH